MDLPDCPPGTEGYEDSVTEIPKKPDEACTKAEHEFQEHLNSLKITLENGEQRCMVERQGRDISGKWKYFCYPCAAVCSGETILQTHLSGRKHKNKLSLRSTWPISIFNTQPSNQNKNESADKVLQKNTDSFDLEQKFKEYSNVRCHIQDALDQIKTSLVGLEYLVEHPPRQAHYEPSYLCVLCNKQGHPRTIVNHMTCFWHCNNYIVRHFGKAAALFTPYRKSMYREGTGIVMSRLAQRIEDTYGRMRPLHIDKDEFEQNKNQIIQWIFKGKHFTETDGCTFEEVVDVKLITSLSQSDAEVNAIAANWKLAKRDLSPPVVAAPTKPKSSSAASSLGKQSSRAKLTDVLSDISDEDELKNNLSPLKNKNSLRFEPYPSREKDAVTAYRSRHAIRNVPDTKDSDKAKPNYAYKVGLAKDKRIAAEKAAAKALEYHEKNPEKHPLYPEEWKKFWNKRYKEIQAEGKDPSKHDFKPEWIVFWTKRMKELHDNEFRIQVEEIYRKLNITPPRDLTIRSEERHRSKTPKRRSPEPKIRSVDAKRRSPDLKKRTSDLRRHSPDTRRPSSDSKRGDCFAPVWQTLGDRRRSPDLRRDSRRDKRRSPARRSPGRRTPVRRSPARRSPSRVLPSRRSPSRHSSARRSPLSSYVRMRSRSPRDWRRSPLSSERFSVHLDRSGSPLSRRDATLPLRNRSPVMQVAPSMQTVLISDEEFQSDGDSSMSVRRSPARSQRSRSHRRDTIDLHYNRKAQQSSERLPDPQDLGPAENVVATLRLLVALEDYLGSLGPKIVDLLTEALKMEKECANSSEKLLDSEPALVLIETAKEKLKGAMQAGFVTGPAACTAVRSAVVRAAATLHAADERARRSPSHHDAATSSLSSSTLLPSKSTAKEAAVPIAGIGVVDRAQIAQQIAEALIAQGKTDVSAEELAQLVDAVVGMAEAKKMESQKAKAASQSIAEKQGDSANRISGTASALQMLQSAYDENEKRLEKSNVPDAMDGLSDSDLETLLKNFNELSAEEQHSLIAYLKKLEAREPHRVERLRQYVSAAVPLLNDAPPGPDDDHNKPVEIQSDDDEDYSVEEVFQSATQKVKEDKIRQEMEIVKKSLEEFKEPEQNVSAAHSQTRDIPRNISSATDLLALVQASIQSTARVPASAMSVDVVTTNTQPKSFGDLPEPHPAATNIIKPLMENLVQVNQIPAPVHQNVFNNQPSNPQAIPIRPQQNRMNPGDNINVQNFNYNNNQGTWNPQPMNTVQEARPSLRMSNYDNFNQSQYNQVPQANFRNGIQDNSSRPPKVNQHYGGYHEQQQNFRGRGGGRGNYSGPNRGRGRGGYYQ